MTADEWRQAVLDALPDPTTNPHTPTEPVSITTTRTANPDNTATP